MQGLTYFWDSSDAVARSVALLLLLMSVTAWVLIFWKGWLLKRAAADIQRAVPSFWAAPTLAEGRARLAALDREHLLLPLLDAAQAQPGAGTLEGAGQADSQLTRRLRDALHRGLAHLQVGQVLLASVGSTAPFVGLFGPIGEALIMTAAGIAVAVPAVLAFNVFGQRVNSCEAELEGFAHDLRELVLGAAGPRN